VVENVIDHDGSFDRIASSLLEWLDSQLPPPGGYLVLYLCFHSRDRAFFSSPYRSTDLKRALFESYKREIAWDGMGFGDLRFDIRHESSAGPLYLTLREQKVVSSSTKASDKNAAEPTIIEFQWQEGESNILPGTISMQSRWIKPLAGNSLMTAFLGVGSDGNAVTARHRTLWQGEVRTTRPGIYLPEGRNSITIGPTFGCDLLVPQLEAPISFEYDSTADEWNWGAPSAPWLRDGNRKGDLLQEFPSRNGQAPIVIKGERLSEVASLDDIRKQNQLPSFVVEIIGCLLPSPNQQAEWSRSVYEIQPALASEASTAIELPGGSWLYCKHDSLRPHLLRVGEAPPGKPLRGGKPLELRAPGAIGPQLQGIWAEVNSELLQIFCGELRLTPPLAARLAADAICGDLPTEIFPEYVDRSLGRPPCRLESGDGRNYRLAFNSSAKHPVFVFSPMSEIKRYDPNPQAIELGTGADFIFGATHYRLRRLPDVLSDEVSA
jgi:hypothetical protein